MPFLEKVRFSNGPGFEQGLAALYLQGWSIYHQLPHLTIYLLDQATRR